MTVSSRSLNPGQSAIVQSNGRSGHKLMGTNFWNPHDIDDVQGDPLVLANHDATSYIKFRYHNATDTYYIDTGGMTAGERAVITSPNGQIVLDSEGISLLDTLALQGRSAAATADVTLVPATPDTIIPMDCTSGNLLVNLPALADANAGTVYFIFRTDATGNTLTITPSGTDTIDGAATKALAANEGAAIYAGSEWRTFIRSGGSSGSVNNDNVEWWLQGQDASTVGNKVAWQVPYNCTIVRALMGNPNDVNTTVDVNFRRATSANWPGTWDGAALNPSALSLTAAVKTEDTTLSGWTTSLTAKDWVRVEINTADASLTDLVVVLEVQPV